MQFPLNVTEAEQHIDHLRALRSTASPDIAATLDRLIKTVGEDLYSQSTHFIEELIQNADDNSYTAEVEPNLAFTLENGVLRVDCNERGFTRDNVEGICDAVKSTKKGLSKENYVGEKGIGFKSVFKVADVVFINSGHYTFKFDKRVPLGMITPIWVKKFPLPKKQDHTSFLLMLAPDRCDTSKLIEGLYKLQAQTLIFLRRVKKISVVVTGPSMKPWKATSQRQDFLQQGHDIVQISRNSKPLRYLLRTKLVENMPNDERRREITRSEIALAFPLDAKSEPTTRQKSEFVFAFLPIRPSGLSFVVHADFILAANRQDLVHPNDNPWNRTLLTAVADSVSDSFRAFATDLWPDTNFKWKWPCYIPELDFQSPLVDVNNRIRSYLKSRPIFMTESGSPDRLASLGSLMLVPGEFRDESGLPFTKCEDFDHKYLANRYAEDEIKKLKGIGLSEMGFPQFLEDLKSLFGLHPDEMQKKQKHYYAALANVLQKFMGSEVNAREIRNLPLIRIRGRPGRPPASVWVAASDGDIFFPGDGRWKDIPEGIDAMIVQNQYANSRQLALFYQALGVKQLSKDDICQLIIKTHESPSFKPLTLPRESIIAHTTFLYRSKFTDRKKASRLYVLADDNRFHRASTTYQNIRTTHNIRKYLPSYHPVLHTDYTDTIGKTTKELLPFSKWLEDHMDVWRIPRLARFSASKGFELTPEFQKILDMDSVRYLELLRHGWPTYEKWFNLREHQSNPVASTSLANLKQSLSLRQVKCFGGGMSPMFKTFFPFPNWIKESPAVPYLDILGPMDGQSTEVWAKDWAFLDHFCVVRQQSVQSCISCLVAIASSEQPDAEVHRQVLAVYEQLEDCLNKDFKSIREAFQSQDLIFKPPTDHATPGQWIPLKKATWKGPELRHFLSIGDIYPEHSRLFVNILEIQDLEVDNLIYELKHMDANENLSYIKKVFEHLNQWFNKAGGCMRPEVKSICNEEAFPIHSSVVPSTIDYYDKLESCGPFKDWFIADREDLMSAFAGVVPLLAFDVDTNIGFQNLFTGMGLGHRLLSGNVTKSPIIEGDCKKNPYYTSLLRSKIEFLLRLIPETLDNRHTLTLQVKNLQVVGVSSLRSQWSIKSMNQMFYGHLLEARAVLRVEENALQIYLQQAQLDSGNLVYEWDLAEELVALCNVEEKFKILMYLLLSQPDHEEIRRQFSNKGVRNLTQEEEKDTARYFKNETKAQEQKKVKNYHDITSEIKQLAEGYEMRRKIRIFTQRTIGSQRGANQLGKTRSRHNQNQNPGNATNNGVVNYVLNSDLDDSSDSDSNEERVEGSQFLITSGSKALKRRLRNRYKTTSVNSKELVAGEKIMADILADVLGTLFDPIKHWTSQYRVIKNYEPPFQDEMDKFFSSFSFPDPSGLFTRFMTSCGLQEMENWLSHPPNYHMEVIGSKDGLKSSFPMRNEFWKKARKYSSLSASESDTVPRHVCILVRVYHLGTGDPNMDFYLDPWQLFLEGVLEMAAQDKYIARIRKER